MSTHSLPLLDGARLPLAAPDKARPTAGKRNMTLKSRQTTFSNISPTQGELINVIMHDI